MAYQDLFAQRAATPYTGPAYTAPPVAQTLPTPVAPTTKPTAGPAPGISGGVAGGAGGYQALVANPAMLSRTGPILPVSTAANPIPGYTQVVSPKITQPVPGSSSPTYVPPVTQAKVDLLGKLGVQKTAAQMGAGAAKTAYTNAYLRSISNR